ncbi:MAG: hypothetical protein GXP16_07595 [Gammaproteobacteria bacterium]|nr:hypothetical protein [Gammaproteobacteria bacterium]
MPVNLTYRQDTYVIEVCGAQSALSIINAIVAHDTMQDWNALILDARQATSQYYEVSELLPAFQQLEYVYGEIIEHADKLFALVAPRTKQGKFEAFDFFFDMVSNYFEWAVRLEHRRIRQFETMAEAEQWIANSTRPSQINAAPDLTDTNHTA